MDGITSWEFRLFGHGKPTINEALWQELRRLDQAVLADFLPEPAILLAKSLVTYLPQVSRAAFSAARVH